MFKLDTKILARLKKTKLLKKRKEVYTIVGSIIFVVIVAGSIATFNILVSNSYKLSASIQNLVGPPDQSLLKQFAYDKKTASYILGQSSINKSSTEFPGMGHQSGHLTIGYNPNGRLPFSVKLPTNINSGITTYDNKSNLSFTMIPLFKTLPGQYVSNHLVYPIGVNGPKLIYTVKANGTKEDIVYSKAPNSIVLRFKLKLPSSLEARMMPGGNLGIYSANPALFGNISYGSLSDQQAVISARENSVKNNLVFVLPALKIFTDNGKVSSASHNLKISLSGDIVTISASRLNQIHGSFSIDPSIVVVSASNWQLGNNESDIQIDTTNNQITEGSLTGGSAGSWSTTTALPAAVYSATTVVYNGYIYEIGGYTTTLSPVVDYATISAGTIGAWNPTTSLPLGTYYATSVVYNGYIYEIGGNDGSGSPSVTVVDYAQVNSNGTLGAWTATTSLPTAASVATSVVYNGYIYEMGGNDSTGTVMANVYYAPVNANGTLGAWTATTSLPVATKLATSVVYNGYIYEMGGNNGTAGVTTVYYVPINSNGSLGAWITTTALPAAYASASGGVYNGYIYLITSTAHYAPINSDGTIGAWTATNGVGVSVTRATSAVLNGYVYELAGTQNGTNVATVTSVAINPVGYLGVWTATTSLPAITAYATSVAYNGYLFEIGGQTTSTSPVTTVDSALICTTANSGIGGCTGVAGAIGTWTATTSLPVATSESSSIEYNGYVYEIGGLTSAATAVVYYAQITGGTLGTWNTTTSLPAATFNSASITANGYVYEIGGAITSHNKTVTQSAVYYALICTTLNSGVGGCTGTAGTLGTWSTTTSLPVTTDVSTATTNNTYVYLVGGYNGTSIIATVYYALICTTLNSGVGGCTGTAGTLGTWSTTTSLPTATDYDSVQVNNGYLYEIGGYTTASTAVVQYALINSNGTLGAWTTTAALPTGTAVITSAVYGGFLYKIGGYTTANVATVDYAQINNGGPGTLSSWNTTTSLPAATDAATSVAYNGYVYEIGGNSGSVSAVVDYAPINSNGTLGTWTATTSLPAATDAATSVAYNGYVYEIGGYTTATTAVVDYALICTSTNSGLGGCTGTAGALGTWTATTSLPAAVQNATSVAYNGYVYEIGGGNTVVDYALICTSTNSGLGGCTGTAGALGTWTATTSLPTMGWYATSVAYNGYLYEIGGNSGSNPTSLVYYAPISSNGALGTWTATTSLINIINGTLGDSMATSVAYNGYVYEIEGSANSTAATGVEYAPINSDGTLGNWTETSVPATGLYMATSVVYNGYVYEIGGATISGSTLQSTVSYAGLQSLPRVGRYSMLLDFTGSSTNDPTPIEILVNGGACNSGLCTTNLTNPGLGGISGPGGIRVRYEFASNACTTFNSQTKLPLGLSFLGLPKPLVFTSNGCGSTTNIGRYMFVTYILDDTQTATFPDVFGNRSSLSYSTVYYHPASAYRLRGGKTFSNGSLQTLDAPPL